MAVIVAQTRKELRQTVGYRTGAMVAISTTSAGTTTSFTDTELANSDGAYNGYHFVQTSGANDGSIRIVDEYTGGSKTGRFRTAMSSAVASGVTGELWAPDMPPARLHDFINEAIRGVTRKASPPVTNVSIHTSRRLTGYDVPTAVVGIQRVEYRSWVDHEDIENCDAAWSESNDADVTVSLDDEDYREGSGAVKLVVAGTVSAGDILASQVVSVDLSGMTHVEFWIKSSTAVAASDLALILSTTANAGTETEKIAVPATTAGEWQRVRVALANPQSDTAIISVGLEYDANAAANDIWIDGIEATREDSETWEPVHRNFWRIDKDQRKLFFDPEGVHQVGHSLLKLIGRQKPSELTTDTATCDVDPIYITEYVHAQVLRARADRNASSREAAHLEADRREAIAMRRLARIQTPSGVRWVDD